MSSGCQSFCLSKIPCSEWKSPTCASHRCLWRCEVRSSCVPLPLVVSMHSLSPTFFSRHDVKSNCKGFFSPLSLNGLPHLSFQPVFSLGSLPGKQEKHLNQWKMCLTVLGSTAPLCPAILQRYKTLQPHQLETSDWATIMKWEVKYARDGREEGEFCKVFNVQTLIHHCTWKSCSMSWGNHFQVSAAVARGPQRVEDETSLVQLHSCSQAIWCLHNANESQQPADFLRGFIFVQEKQKLACLALPACMHVTVY